MKNIGLVYKIAHKLKKQQPFRNVIGRSVEDYLGIGYIGLTKAEKNYDPKKGKFSSYAYPIIIREFINEVKRNLSPFSYTQTNLEGLNLNLKRKSLFGIVKTEKDNLLSLRMEECLNRLPEETADLIKQKYFMNKKLREIEGKGSIQNIHQKIQKGLNRLREIW